MKTCPSCQTQYTDDTLRFCLQDGAVLENARTTQLETVSLAGQEMETVARSALTSPETAIRQPQSEVTRVSSRADKPAGVSKLVLAISAFAVVLLLLVGVGAVAIWLYLPKPEPITKNTGNSNNVNNANSGITNSTVSPTPSAVPSPTATVLNKNTWSTPLPTADLNLDQARREISQQVNSWKSNAEAGDLDSQMRRYAPSVHYYRKRGASRDFIRADRARAYRLFDSMSIDVSNMGVLIDDSGETATAVFDKEWIFEGTRRSTGKVRQQLQFRKIDGKWLITGERDLKVYYTN